MQPSATEIIDGKGVIEFTPKSYEHARRL